MKATIYTLAIIAAFIVSAAYAPRAHAEDASRASYSPREAFTPAPTFAPFGQCKAITRIVFDYAGQRSPEACGLAEDNAFDVWQYFTIRPYESAAVFAGWHDSASASLTTEQIETWIVTFAAGRLAAYQWPGDPRMAQGERVAAMEGLAALIHGVTPAPEWQSTYGRFLRR